MVRECAAATWTTDGATPAPEESPSPWGTRLAFFFCPSPPVAAVRDDWLVVAGTTPAALNWLGSCAYSIDWGPYPRRCLVREKTLGCRRHRCLFPTRRGFGQLFAPSDRAPPPSRHKPTHLSSGGAAVAACKVPPPPPPLLRRQSPHRRRRRRRRRHRGHQSSPMLPPRPLTASVVSLRPVLVASRPCPFGAVPSASGQTNQQGL